MIKVTLNENNGIALLEPIEKLSEEDFKQVSMVIDPYIEKAGKLNGIIIYSKDFPYWENFAGFLGHMKFIKHHHKNLARVALVTDSKLVNAAEHIAKHFVSAEIKKFPFDQLENAEKWVPQSRVLA